jgi:quercetin dioxygenase-like cupin family protein
MCLTEPVLIGPSAGRTVTKSSGSSTELKLSGEQADGGWAVVEWHLRAGDEPPIHTHTREDETLYVLDGSITAFVGDQRIDVEAGSYAALPKNVAHGLTVRGDEARLLITHSSRRVPSTSSCPATSETPTQSGSGSCCTTRACKLTSDDHKGRGDPRRSWRT